MLLVVRLVGALLGWLAGSVLRVRRAHVEASMRAAGIARPAATARAMYAALGASLVEFLWMAARGRRALEHVAVAPGSRAAWSAALAQGKGVVVAASHTGNWDLAACAIARDVELLVVTKHLSVGWLDRIWQSTRARLGVRLTGAHGALARAREVLGRAGAVAMMIDQAPGSARHAVAVGFLGQPALADRAAAALAASAGCPLVVATSRRLRGGHHELCVLAVHVPPRRPGRSWIDAATREATGALEAFVRDDPAQWLWLHRRWKLMLGRPCRTLSSSPVAASKAA